MVNIEGIKSQHNGNKIHLALLQYNCSTENVDLQGRTALHDAGKGQAVCATRIPNVMRKLAELLTTWKNQ